METTQVTNFRREVLRRIASYTWNDCLPEHIYDIVEGKPVGTRFVCRRNRDEIDR